MLLPHRSLKAYCATLWWRWRKRWSAFLFFQVMEHRWNKTDREKPKYSGKNLSQCHFVHHKFHMDWPGMNPGLRRERPATNRLSHGTVLWIRQLVAGISSRRPDFDPRSVHVRFVVDKVALGQVFFRVLRFFPCVSFHQCSILTIYTLLLLGQTGEAWKASKKQCSFGNRGPLDRKEVSLLF
jgi:hypothetical protein